MRTLSDHLAIFASRVWYRWTGKYLPRPVLVNMFGGELLQVLIPNGDGLFDAVWRFEPGDERRPAVDLICTVTPSEARAIAHRDQAEIGFLEPIRDGMDNRNALLSAVFTDARGRRTPYVRGYYIPNASKDETNLAADLDRAVTQVTAIHFGKGAKGAKRNVTKTKSWAKDSPPAGVRETLREVRALVPA